MADNDIKDEADLLQKSRSLLIDTIARQLQGVYQAKVRGGQLCLSAIAPTPAPPSGRTAAGANLMFDVARLSLSTWEQWLKLADSGFQFVADTLQSPQPQPEAVRLPVSGSIGEVAKGYFAVDNPFATRATVSFSSPELYRVDGTRRLRTDVVFSRLTETGDVAPGSAFVLEPSTSARFMIALTLDNARATGTYRGECTATVDNYPAGRLCIELEVLPAARPAS
jgi:hypothetical protein